MKILIIEDDKNIAYFLRKSFESEFSVVDVAYSGEEGLDMYSHSKYDVIILDYILPKKNGLDVCKKIRATDPVTPIIVLSVKSRALTKAAMLNAGVDDYLSKPFEFDELIARVRAVLRRPREKKQINILKIGSIVLEKQNREIIRGKKHIRLSRKEFLLLEYFMENIGTVLSKKMIMDHVWHMDVDPFSNTVEAHVLALRHKFSDNGFPNMIYTVPMRGYKFDA